MDTSSVVERLRKLKEYVEELQRFVHLSLAEYLADKDRQIVVERLMQLAAQVCIDLGNYLVAYYGLQTPDKPENIFVVLGRANLIPEPLAQRMVSLVRFRNVLVHGYLVIDPVKVQAALANDTDLFLTFAQAIYELLERERKADGEEST
jgi:uncharacterized protein YutE (UPF0331/DUF86 family)